MTKRFELFFNFITIPLDFLLVFLASVSSYKLRFQEFITDIRPAVYSLDFSYYLKMSFYLAFFVILIFIILGVYKIKSNKSFVEEFSKIIVSTTFAMMFFVIYIFFQREYLNSRFIILFAGVFTVLYLTIYRAIITFLRHLLYKKGFGNTNVVLVGVSGNNFNIIKNEFDNNKRRGFNIVKTVKNYDEFLEFLRNNKEIKIDEIVKVNSNYFEDTLKFMDFCEYNHIVLKYVADLFDARTTNIEIDTSVGIPLIEVKKTKLDGWGRIIKRFIDIIFSIFFIILFSPIFIITMIAIKLNSKGSVFYKNERIGQNNTVIKVLKFRSMYSDYCTGNNNHKAIAYEKELIKKYNSRNGAIYKIKNDPRITGVGKFIRKYSIDELPQFFNVLIGSMSIIGPRPHQKREVEKYDKKQLRILDIKPGITGLAQVSGRSDLNSSDEFKLDKYYIDNWSLFLDFKILFKTPFAVLRKRKVD
ncbi:sugar transferase [Patescibacteria group bacterium]|nr:sugar transferase [Patescibacteria group bacterium]